MMPGSQHIDPPGEHEAQQERAEAKETPKAEAVDPAVKASEQVRKVDDVRTAFRALELAQSNAKDAERALSLALAQSELEDGRTIKIDRALYTVASTDIGDGSRVWTLNRTATVDFD